MTRILLIDDEDRSSHVRQLKEGIERDLEMPDPEVIFIRVDSLDSESLRAQVTEMAKEHWDAIMIDVNLYPENPGLPQILVPCQVIEGFRQQNKTAMAFIYSGLIEQHIDRIFSMKEGGKSNEVEQHIRSIFELGISAFSAANRVVDDVINHFHRLPQSLQIERELMKHATRKVRGDVSEFACRTFGDLAGEVRSQSKLGVRLVNEVTLHGIAAIVDLNR